VLESLFHDLNRQHFAGELPVPVLAWNPRLSTTAGRFCPGSRKLFREQKPLIEVAAYLRSREDGAEHIRDTLLHEMVHYQLWHQKKPYGHTAEFHAILKRVGGKRYNPVPIERAPKHFYECPNCLVRFPTKRKLGEVACAICCKNLNAGRFSAKFLLVRLSPEEAAKRTSEHLLPESVAEEEILLPREEVVARIQEIKTFLQNKSRTF
jgi:predicted SprT family Zn-dependent metalloprotease